MITAVKTVQTPICHIFFFIEWDHPEARHRLSKKEKKTKIIGNKEGI